MNDDVKMDFELTSLSASFDEGVARIQIVLPLNFIPPFVPVDVLLHYVKLSILDCYENFKAVEVYEIGKVKN